MIGVALLMSNALELVPYAVAIIAGSLVGILTGSIPGIHVNLVAALVAASFPALDQPNLALPAVLFVVAVATVHSFFDIIPTVFVGVPGDEAHSLLPGHRMVRAGRGMDAVHFSAIGSWYGLLLGLAVMALLLVIGQHRVDAVVGYLNDVMFWLLLGAATLIIVTDKHRGWAFGIFVVSGMFGILIFATPLIPGGTNAPISTLFPALTGLFGMSGLILSLGDKAPTLPEQQASTEKIRLDSSVAPALINGAVGGMVVGVLPGLGSANAATLLSLGRRTRQGIDNDIGYIVTTSAISTTDAMFSIAALYLLGSTRSGASVAIDRIIPEFNQQPLWTVVAVGVAILTAGYVGRQLLLFLGLRLAKFVGRMNYRALSVGVIAALISIVWATTGWWGLLILFGTTALGMVAPLAGVRRAQAMGMFLVPTILYFSGKSAAVVSALRIEAVNLPPPEVDLGFLLSVVGASALVGAVVYHIVKVVLSSADV